VLCSLAGDLKIFEIVDSGVWNVGCTVPRAILPAA
jgi:acetamidase/formamidase